MTEPWDGVRNFQARNFLRDQVKVGDRVLFYHSNIPEPAVVGLAEVVRAGYPDFTARDPKGEHFDPTASPDQSDLVHGGCALREPLMKSVTLESIKNNPLLADMPLVKRSRLSIQPVTEEEWRIILSHGRGGSPDELPATRSAWRNLCYSIGGRKILEDFDFCLERGVNRTILGVSGAGKTTILKLLLGLLEPDAGRVFIGDLCITGLPESRFMEQRKRIAIVFQGGALFDSMTVGENVGYRLFEEGRLSEAEIKKIVVEKLSFVGVEAALNLYPAELSGGMKKRVAIARALAADPDYIFFDEPTTGLDPIGVYNICNLMQRLQAEGKTTLMVTHDLVTAFATSQRFTFLHQARMLFEGSEEEMKASSIPEVREFLRADRNIAVCMNQRIDANRW